MRTLVSAYVMTLLLAAVAAAAPKPHVINFGKVMVVKWFAGTDEMTALDLKVRPLFVDAKLREFTLGNFHDVTDRLFVVRRAFRVNDALSDEPVSPKFWRWERDGWLLVDRGTGRISPVSLPEFDSYFSSASWYRDYVAYCGVSEDGKKVSAVVAQLGRRKPLLKKPLGPLSDDEKSDSACAAPVWQRQPARVTFDAGKDQKFTYSVRGHSIDMIDDEDADSTD